MRPAQSPIDDAVRAALEAGNVRLKRVQTRIDYARFSGGDTLARFDDDSGEDAFAVIQNGTGQVLCVVVEGHAWEAQRVVETTQGEMRLNCWVWRRGATLAEVLWKVLLCEANERAAAR